MRVAHDDDVWFGIHRCQCPGVVLRPDAARVVARRPEAAVNQHHFEICAVPVESRHRPRCHFGDAAHSGAAGKLRAIPQHHARRGQSRNADLDGAARHQYGLREHQRARRVLHVSRYVVVRGLGRSAPQEGKAEVEVVIARRDGVVLQRVQRVDDGLRLPFVVAAEERRERVSLQQITGIDQHDVAGIAGAQRFERRGHAGEPAGRHAIAHVIPAEHAAVNVGRGDDDDVGGVRRGGRSRLRISEREEQRGQKKHSAHKIAKRAALALPSGLFMATDTLAVQRILVVDDEPDITALVAYHLAKEGYRVTTAGTGADALRSAREERPDLVVLDLMLPGHSGFEVLAELRRRDETRDVGVLLLTARKEEPDRIKGLTLGADDYLAKPFSPKELVLRVGAILRRLAAPPVAAGGRLVGGPIIVDRSAHRVTADGKEVELTATEFKLLERLIERRDRVQSRSQLLESVWQAQPDIQTRTVDMHVQRLRTKLGAAGEWIETVRAVGYRFREPATPPVPAPPPASRRRHT